MVGKGMLRNKVAGSRRMGKLELRETKEQDENEIGIEEPGNKRKAEEQGDDREAMEEVSIAQISNLVDEWFGEVSTRIKEVFGGSQGGKGV